MSVTIIKFSQARVSDGLIADLKAKYDFYLEEELDDDERDAVLARAEVAVMSGGTPVSGGYLDRMPKLKMIGDFGVGYDKLDVELCQSRGIVASHTPDVLNDDVADLGVFLLAACARRLVEAHRFVTDRRWGPEQFPLTTSMKGLKVGIAGLGRIGSAIAHRLEAFGCEIAYYARHEKTGVSYPYFDNMTALAAWSTALILILPATAQTFHAVNAEVLKALGPQGILVNVARGAIVDTRELIAALREGTIAAAGLDVFEDEPDVPSALMKLPQVVLSPHLGSATTHTRQAMGDLVLHNIEAYLGGKPLITPIPGLAGDK